MVILGRPDGDPERPRLVEPELRSRVVGYLAAAPEVAPGHRGDGGWVWPTALAEDARGRGVGPDEAHLDHMAARSFVPPATLPGDALDDAARALASGRVTTAAHPSRVYLAGRPRGTVAVTHVIRRTADGDSAPRDEQFGPYGWHPTDVTALSTMEFERLTPAEAAGLIDGLGATWHDRRRRDALESDPVPGLTMARVFDGESAAGVPWFSPVRLRIVEPERRERIARYLTGCRMAVRVTGGAADPLNPGSGNVVPLNVFTDGVWVWQEALAHYVRGRGVAPELALLCHIEERGCRPPATVPDEAVAAAASMARQPVSPRPPREPMRYYLATAGSLLVRAPGGDALRAEALEADLRWRDTGALRRIGWPGVTEISADEAVRVVDDRLSRADAMAGSLRGARRRRASHGDPGRIR